MASVAESSSLFEIDAELDGLLEEIEGQVETEGQAAEDLVARFQEFCEAHGEKVDRIGRFVRIMEARELRRSARVTHLCSPEVSQGRNRIKRGRDIYSIIPHRRCGWALLFSVIPRRRRGCGMRSACGVRMSGASGVFAVRIGSTLLQLLFRVLPR